MPIARRRASVKEMSPYRLAMYSNDVRNSGEKRTVSVSVVLVAILLILILR